MPKLRNRSIPAEAERARPGRSSSRPVPHPLAVTLGGAAVVLALNLALKATGALQQAAVARVFGAGPETDAYAAAIALPNLLITLLVLGPLSLALTPALVRAAPDAAVDGTGLVSAALSWSLTAAVAVAVAGLLCAPFLTAVLAPGLPADTAALSTGLLRVLLAGAGCAAAAAVLRGVLHAWGQFATPLAAYLGAALLLLGVTLFVAPGWGIGVLPWASLAGALLGFGAQLFIVWRRTPSLRPLTVWRHPGLAGLGRLLALTAVVMASLQGMGLIARHLASHHGTGAVAVMEYALSFDRLVGGTGAAAIATVFYPFLVLRSVAGERPALASATAGALRSVAFVTLLLVGAAVTLAEPLLRVWLQRGRFGPDETAAVALLVRTLAPALIAWSLATPMVYAFHALGRMMVPAMIALGGTAATALFCTVGAATGGLPGIGLGVSAGMVLTCAALGCRLLHDLEVPSPLPALRGGMALALTGATAAAGMALTTALLPVTLVPVSVAGDLLRLAAGGAVGVTIALAVGGVVGIPEARGLAARALAIAGRLHRGARALLRR